jgi:hypothetical protein
MTKLMLLCCLWLAGIITIVASSSPRIETIADRSIDYGSDDYLYGWLGVMNLSTISNAV